jgi:hypothetical protein
MPLSLAANFGEPRENHFHSGVDFRVGGQPGARLYAIADGYISRIVVRPDGYGKAIYIDHPNGTTSVYGHLDTFSPKIKKYIEDLQYKRQRFVVNENLNATVFPVKKGEVLGTAGNSGNSFGAHLHFEIRQTKTQKTLNIISSGTYSMLDNISPKIHEVVFYSYEEVADIPKIEPVYSYTGTEQQRKAAIEVPDVFFIAVDANDRQNGSTGILGINRLLVSLDGEIIFAYRMDGFLFEQSRYINSLTAYDRWISHKRPMIKTYLEPGNKFLAMYDKVVSDGLIRLNDDDEHKLRITAFDDFNNKTVLAIKIKRHTAPPQPEEVTAFEDSIREPKAANFPMYYDRQNNFQTGGLSVTIPKGSLYRSFWFSVDTLTRPAEALSPYWRIHDAGTPLQTSATIRMQADVPPTLQSKAILASYNSKNRPVSSGGKWEDNGLTARIASFGNYFVMIDTIPPVIQMTFKDGADLKKYNKLSVKLSDDLSGISTYNAYIDNTWVLMDYDAKNKVMHYFFDPKRIKRNTNHTITVSVSDRCMNTSTIESRFIW